MYDVRKRFVESWLMEFPQRIPPTSTFSGLLGSLEDFLENGLQEIKISPNIRKLELTTTLFYWYEVAGEIVLIVHLDKTPQSVFVNMVGKKYPQKSPWATELYDAIIQDRGKSIAFKSDVFLSDAGFGIWKRMLEKGRTISVYNTITPGASFHKIESNEELERYFGDSDNFQKYRFVLSEHKQAFLEVMEPFITRRLFELCGRI